MTKTPIALVALLAFAAPALGQAIPIHGHWQKAAYTSPSDCVLLSAQGHWAPANNMPAPINLGHTHLELCAQPWRETTQAAFSVHGQIVLFHVDGHVNAARVEGAPFLERVVWDATGTEVAPPMNGDPMGVVSFGFTATFNPALSVPGTEANTWTVPDHGWWEATMLVQTLFTNGDSTLVHLRMPYFSVKDPSQPIPWWASHFMIRAGVFPASAHSDPADGFGTSISEYVDTYLPILAPLTAPYSVNASSYNYGVISKIAAVSARASFILNPDLHNGIPGTTLRTMTAHGEFGFPMVVTFDPATFAPGPNKFSLTWDQTTEGVEGIEPGVRMTSLLVFSIPAADGLPHPLPPPPTGVELCNHEDDNGNGLVDEGCDDGAPPPPQPPVESCGDGADNDGDGLIDENCAPPPPMWTLLPGTIERSSVAEEWRLCVTGQPCRIVIAKP